MKIVLYHNVVTLEFLLITENSDFTNAVGTAIATIGESESGFSEKLLCMMRVHERSKIRK